MAIGLSLFDLITLQRNDTLTGLVEDVTTAAPEFEVLPVVTRPGKFYEVVRRVALPAAGFRNINAGNLPGQSTYRKEVKQMFFLDSLINMDEAIEQADDKSTGDVWMHEASGAMLSALITLGAQTWYGTSNDVNGFVGLRSQCAGSLGAGGSTNSATAYLVNLNAQYGVRFDVGEGGSIALRPPLRQQITDPNNSANRLFAWVSNLSLWVGLNVMSDKAVYAISGVTAHTTTNVLDQNVTDKLGAQLISNIPVKRQLDLHWFMNRLSQWGLQASRQTFNNPNGYSLQYANAEGTPAWSPKPDGLNGWPITVTDSLTNTESN